MRSLHVQEVQRTGSSRQTREAEEEEAMKEGRAVKAARMVLAGVATLAEAARDHHMSSTGAVSKYVQKLKAQGVEDLRQGRKGMRKQA